jgi:hypothetical protein
LKRTPRAGPAKGGPSDALQQIMPADLGYLCRADEAKGCRLAHILSVNPGHTIAWFGNFGGKFLSAVTLAIWVEGLREAGQPEE